MAKQLKQNDRDEILAEFHTGISQNQLAKNHKVSTATINKICKGIKPKFKEKVNAVATIKAELSLESEYQSECFDKEVNRKAKVEEFLHNATMKNLTSMMAKVKVRENSKDDYNDDDLLMSDHKACQETIYKAGQTLGIVNQPSTQVSVNTQNNLTTKTTLNTQIVKDTLKEFDEEF